MLPRMRPPMPPPMHRPGSSGADGGGRWRAGGLLLLVWLSELLMVMPAQAQLRSETPARLRAEARRARRDELRTPNLPNQDTHLNRSKTQLQRGEGDQPRPEGADAYDYEKGNSPSSTDRNIWGLRRKKNRPVK